MRSTAARRLGLGSGLALLVWITAGCAFSDALTGAGDDDDDDVCDPALDPTCIPAVAGDCSEPIALGGLGLTGTLGRELDLCDELGVEAFQADGCASGGAAAGQLVFAIDIAESGSYELCIDSDVRGTVSLSDSCGGADAIDCYLVGPTEVDCAGGPLAAGRVYLQLETSSPNACGSILFSVQPIADDGVCEGPIDGEDNDGDGVTDCEEPSCRAELCSNPRSFEDCDGLNDQTELGHPADLIDEAACRCVDDTGCDDIDSGTGEVYVCHPSVFGGVCSLDCRELDWCLDNGYECGPDGRCVGEDVCDDGVDNDDDLLTDCEDPSCWISFTPCYPEHSVDEFCNGFDDADTPGFPAGTIDELACGCVSDAGCDDLPTGSDAFSGYVCHTDADLPVCGPPCDELDWCGTIGMTCGAGGRCVF